MCLKLFASRKVNSSSKYTSACKVSSERSTQGSNLSEAKIGEAASKNLKGASRQPELMAPKTRAPMTQKPVESKADELTPPETLAKFHMPPGLLPDTVTDYHIDEDGRFSCGLSQMTYVTFGTGPDAKQVCYNKRITGALKDLQLTNLAGVTAKKFFLWVSITAIGRDDAESAFIKFYVGSISISLPASWFATVPGPDK